MPSLGPHRNCGCDCRDAAIFTPDPNTFNPLCCTAVDGVRPPCSFILNWECAYSCDKLQLYPHQVLRPLCAFNDMCKFVDLWSFDPANPGPQNKELWLDACTWIQRCTGYTQLGSNNPCTSQNLTQFIQWSLDVSVRPVRMTHPKNYVYEQSRADTWNSYGPNTLWLLPPQVSVGVLPPPDACRDGLPKFVCVTPGVSLAIPTDTNCCKQCLAIDFPAVIADTVKLPAQRLVFFPDGNISATFDGEPFNSTCAYSSPIIDYIAETYRQVRLWVMSAVGNGQPSQAYIQFESGAAMYFCSSFTCTDGGTFREFIGVPGMPAELQVVSAPCIRSENDDYGVCPGGDCWQPMAPSNRQDHYTDEAKRCECQDEWCDKIHGGMLLWSALDGSPSLYPECAPGNATWDLTLTDTPSIPASGPVRKMCGTVPGGGEVCLLLYCDGAWQCDVLCNGTFVTRVLPEIVSFCPLRLKGTIPGIDACKLSNGCFEVNYPDGLTCIATPPPSCCADADEPGTIHVTISSSCAFNGSSFALTRIGSHQWSYSGPGPILELSCSAGVWTLTFTISVDPACTVTMTSKTCTCIPIISGTFPTVTLTCNFAGGGCSIGDTMSAELSP